MATYRLEFDAAGEPLLIEEENGTFKTPMNDLPLSGAPRDQDAADVRMPRTQRAA